MQADARTITDTIKERLVERTIRPILGDSG
jgi:hypothetical protein